LSRQIAQKKCALIPLIIDIKEFSWLKYISRRL